MNLRIDEDFYSDPQVGLMFSKYKPTISSKVMWALLLYHHPSSLYYSLDPQSKISLIEEEYLHSPLILKDHEKVTEELLSILLSKPQRLLKSWEKKLEERDEFINSVSYSPTTYEMIDKMLSLTPKMWEQYLKIQSQVAEENESTKTLGDTELSLLDKGVI